MDTVEEFERRVSIAAEDAKDSGFIQTHLVLLDVLRQSRNIRARAFKGNRPVNARLENNSLRSKPQTWH